MKKYIRYLYLGNGLKVDLCCGVYIVTDKSFCTHAPKSLTVKTTTMAVKSPMAKKAGVKKTKAKKLTPKKKVSKKGKK